jgi:hypothetical protein
VCFATDIVTPFALYAVVALAVARGIHGEEARTSLSPAFELLLGYVGMLVSIGLRQVPHLRRRSSDLLRLPVFVLQLTFVMVPLRILAFATMLHQSWATRPATSVQDVPYEATCAEPAH